MYPNDLFPCGVICMYVHSAGHSGNVRSPLGQIKKVHLSKWLVVLCQYTHTHSQGGLVSNMSVCVEACHSTR